MQLSANFRTVGEVANWVNEVFAPQFPEAPTAESPAYVALDPARAEGPAADWQGLYSLTIPANCTGQEAVLEYEADFIARTIRAALDRGTTVLRPEGEATPVGPADFLIITRNTTRLSSYARALQSYGIPHQVTGGAALNESPELKLLHLCLKAVTQPDNAIVLVGLLRSELFGFSDRALYALKRAGGAFAYRTPLPAGLAPEYASSFEDAFARLQCYQRWLAALPPVAAVERIVSDLGLLALAAACPGGDVSAGSLLKALELLRAAQAELWSTRHLVEYLGRLVNVEERYDGVSSRVGDAPAVRIMNLHKVKGLEAPVVFLADPYGESRHDPDLHIDRSGPKVVGYLEIGRTVPGSFTQEILAAPPDWETVAGREKRFAEAETLRLRYVAATRAGAAMIVTRTEKPSRYNPWACFDAHLAAHRELPDPGPQAAPAVATTPLAPADAEAARAHLAEGLTTLTRATYQTVAATSLAASDASAVEPISWEPGPAGDSSEHGTAWGTVLHHLLHLAMQRPEADLLSAARRSLKEEELPLDLAPVAVETVRAMITSELWQRAQRSPACHAEAPFQILDDTADTPTLVRGVIDLIFKEGDGWVLVDYKSDRLPNNDPTALVAKYAPQLNLYARPGKRPRARRWWSGCCFSCR